MIRLVILDNKLDIKTIKKQLKSVDTFKATISRSHLQGENFKIKLTRSLISRPHLQDHSFQDHTFKVTTTRSLI